MTTDPATSANSRTPSLDLDSVYGDGPVASPQLYDPADRDKLRIGFGGLFEDLPRVDDGTNTAIIPDPRNDENLIIAGLQCAFVLFHNRAVDWVRAHRRVRASPIRSTCVAAFVRRDASSAGRPSSTSATAT